VTLGCQGLVGRGEADGKGSFVEIDDHRRVAAAGYRPEVEQGSSRAVGPQPVVAK
jgi:hypothetical protein